ncbi:amino acid permease-domain-containing protein [Mycotypha africana]|uniref:amino acid permease-domain-containing protein n=1 Tax=Mycotypha africana TaxID=64632 RepID=UPI002301154A|nr:amino acid permease-domain-containing protein [Mycotypha africana]KAI8977615.1 amino acid permease-domain-containing protein [Mycotypha africana]
MDSRLSKENSITSVELGTIGSRRSFEVEEEAAGPVPHMGLMSSCNMIIGLIIGSGIFASPGPVTAKVGAVGPSLIIWVVAGAISMIGALCYAELGTMITKSGGEYQYLKSSYGVCIGILFSWANLILSNPIGTASIATVFAQYIMQMAYFNPDHPDDAPHYPSYALKLVTIGCIWVVVFLNAFGRKAGAMVANIFTAAKLVALVMIIIIGWVWLGKGHTGPFKTAFSGGTSNALDYGTAMYMALFSYNGWNNLNYGISEVKNPKRTLPLAITISCILVTVVYVLANMAYFATLPLATVATSSTVAMQLGMVSMGKGGAYFFALMVILSTFGAVNGNVWAASRLVVTAAKEDGVFMPPFFGKLNEKRQTPIRALIFVGVISTIWSIPGDFTYLATLYSFINFFFYGCAILGLIVMRFRKKTKHLPRPFKIWLPFAIFFVIIDIYIVIAPLVDAGASGVAIYVICICVALLAIPMWFIRVRKPGIGRRLFGWIPGYSDPFVLEARRKKELERSRSDDNSFNMAICEQHDFTLTKEKSEL